MYAYTYACRDIQQVCAAYDFHVGSLQAGHKHNEFSFVKEILTWHLFLHAEHSHKGDRQL